MYDFGLSNGDTLTKAKGYYLSGNYDNTNTPIMVINIDTIQTEDGLHRKRFHIGPYPNISFVIIEGIGNISAHFTKKMDLLLGGEIEDPTFSCYKQSSKCIVTSPVSNCGNCFPFPLGISEVSKQQEEKSFAYPNPVTHILYFKPIYEKQTQLNLYNSYGQKVFTQLIDLFNQNIGIDVSVLPNGVYTYKLNSSKNHYRGKFIKE